jgi:2-phospho-L-lactate/phosphoenolpyruvate guanylyltransferase
MSPVVLVAVKNPSNAKSRMSPFLTVEERFALVWAMFEDLGRALRPLRCPVVLVTNSDRASAYAEQAGWRVLREAEQISESASVDLASQRLAEEGVDSVLRLPADLPLVRSDDVVEILSLAKTERSAALVPSWDWTGTNALLRTPPCLFPSRFGRNSFAMHAREAALRSVPLEVIENPRLALDLDDVSDIIRFLAQAGDGETYRTLLSFHLDERLGRYVIERDPHTGAARHS